MLDKERAPKRAMDKNHLLKQLQSLRLKLHEIAEARGSLTDPDVLAISEEADQLIVALQYIQRNELTHISIRRDHL
ncbi:Spo0E family sporulation regulatory protein-aspartic acid phosphatase [Paenibacillus sp. sgz302251]|uniref:Spo0E family sporulation regulatory protein-aspartic acid phosphatase n=1 Tax=Paenibacillus sp. sgz302251 TaxID=3414493 RepID=UPI003C7A977D